LLPNSEYLFQLEFKNKVQNNQISSKLSFSLGKENQSHDQDIVEVRYTTKGACPDAIRSLKFQEADDVGVNSVEAVFFIDGEVNDNGAEIEYYLLEIEDEPLHKFDSPPFSVTLNANTKYKVNCFAVNSHGKSPTSNCLTIKTRATKPAPPDLTCEALPFCTGIKIITDSSNLKKPASDTQYRIEMKQTPSSKKWKELSCLKFSDLGSSKTISKFANQPLQERCSYQIRIYGRNKAGDGSHRSATVTTGWKKPSRVGSLSVKSESEIYWQKGVLATGYKVRLVRKGDVLLDTQVKNTVLVYDGFKNLDEVVVTSIRAIGDEELEGQSSQRFVLTIPEKTKNKSPDFSSSTSVSSKDSCQEVHREKPMSKRQIRQKVRENRNGNAIWRSISEELEKAPYLNRFLKTEGQKVSFLVLMVLALVAFFFFCLKDIDFTAQSEL